MTARQKFVAFVHKQVKPELVDSPEQIDELAQLLATACERIELVKGRDGTLLVFLDTGFNAYVFPSLRSANDLDLWRQRTTALTNELRRRLAGRRVCLVTPLDLEAVISHAPLPPTPHTLSRFLAGDSSRPLYETAKVCKFLAQLANPDVPVLTFDEDVLGLTPDSPGDDAEQAAPIDFAANIGRLLAEYDRRLASGRPFVISGQYLSAERAAVLFPGGGPIGDSSDAFDALTGSATRTMFLADDAAEPGRVGPLRLEAVRAFFGSLGTTQIAGLGAPAFGVPISGAGIVMSPELSRKPPFSSCRQGWIFVDDYFRCVWHALEDGADIGISADAIFQKPRVHRDLRELTEANVQWHIHSYLNSLMLGMASLAILDARCWSSDQPHANDPAVMWGVARERLRLVVEVWGDPQLETTALGSFVRGKRTAPYAPRGLHDAVDAIPAEYPGRLTGSLSSDSTLADRLRVLVDDFVDYPVFLEYWRNAFVPEFLRNLANERPWRIE